RRASAPNTSPEPDTLHISTCHRSSPPSLYAQCNHANRTSDYEGVDKSSSSRSRVPPMEASRVVRARMARQRLTDETDPLRFRAVSRNTSSIGSSAAHRSCRRNWNTYSPCWPRDDVELHLVPGTVAVHDGLDGAFCSGL